MTQTHVKSRVHIDHAIATPIVHLVACVRFRYIVRNMRTMHKNLNDKGATNTNKSAQTVKKEDAGLLVGCLFSVFFLLLLSRKNSVCIITLKNNKSRS